MSVAKISTKGQVTIPAQIRNFLGVKPGSHIHFVIKGDTVNIERASQGIASLKGKVPVTGEQDFTMVRQQTMREVAHEIASELNDNRC